MANAHIYTIGYGNRSVEEVITLLQRYEIACLVDVRSQPYSRYKPEFSKAALERRLSEQGIGYLFMGDLLGGRPADESCYVNGKVDYALLRAKAFYQEGIRRLLAAAEGQRLALLCSEAKPRECHRSKLIGNTLVERQVAVAHIDEAGTIKSQEEVNEELTGGQLPLFEQESLIDTSGKVGRSRKRYNKNEEKK